MRKVALVILAIAGCSGEAPGLLPVELDGCTWYHSTQSLDSVTPGDGSCGRLETSSREWLLTVGKKAVCEEPEGASRCVVMLPGERAYAYSMDESEDMDLIWTQGELDASGGCPLSCD